MCKIGGNVCQVKKKKHNVAEASIPEHKYHVIVDYDKGLGR